MNSIHTDKDKFNFKPQYGGNEFLSIKIDGEWIDKLFDRKFPGYNIDGTISTLSFRMETDEEEKIVWERFLPKEKTTIVSPILMCPDDCDFSCTLVVAEIEATEDVVTWKRIGMDNSSTFNNKSNVGTDVIWFEPSAPFVFMRNEYIKVISDFKEQYAISKKEYEEYAELCKKLDEKRTHNTT